ncbi:MAG TPA: ribonuclease E/G [Alphaproteobacteria bacterium]|nr:ribonuclease E/G [Alphaproteobacteria bacterium]
MGSVADEILVECRNDTLRTAALAKGELIELVTEPLRSPGAPGSLYVGRVLGRVPAMRAVFVDIGLARPALLDIEGELPREGTIIPVQVVEAAFADKGARVSRRLAIEGRYAVLLPNGKGVAVSRRIAASRQRQQLQDTAAKLKAPREGLIVRAAAVADTGGLAAEIAGLRARWDQIRTALAEAAPPACVFDTSDGVARLLRRFITEDVPRFAFDDRMLGQRARATAERLFGVTPEIEIESEPGRLFDRHGIGDILASLEASVIRLPSGGRLAIEQTAAVTAIDVDTADGTALGADAPLRVDLEAAEEIGRQIRLRDVGGVIVIDFVRLKDRAQRAKVEAVLRRATALDRITVQLLGWTAAGLFEMIRPRGRAVGSLD